MGESHQSVVVDQYVIGAHEVSRWHHLCKVNHNGQETEKRKCICNTRLKLKTRSSSLLHRRQGEREKERDGVYLGTIKNEGKQVTVGYGRRWGGCPVVNHEGQR
ncbi:hypothetical protein U1Q18_048587 [Sarracenia purpurea var. burkii]